MPPINNSANRCGDSESRKPRVSSTNPKPTSLGTILRSNSQALATGSVTVSVNTSCSSTTSTSRSRNLSMKSK